MGTCTSQSMSRWDQYYYGDREQCAMVAISYFERKIYNVPKRRPRQSRTKVEERAGLGNSVE